MKEDRKNGGSKKVNVVGEYRKFTDYIGEWGEGVSKERLIGNIHRNVIGYDKMNRLRPIEDLAYFLLIAKQYGLNPLRKEVYPVYQRSKVGDQWIEKLEPIVSIHGFRRMARESKNPTYAYTGKAVFVFKDSDGTKLDSATVEVYGYFSDPGKITKIGEYTAYMEEFCKTHSYDDRDGKFKKGDPQGTWATMPRVMLAKCAEANAIRASFGLGGIYLEEEIGDGTAPRLAGGKDAEEGEVV